LGLDFWVGILIGFVLSVAFWVVTTKWLVARLRVHQQLTETVLPDGRIRHIFMIENVGYRDAIDVNVSCTLYSLGWAGDPKNLIATVAIPVSVGRILIMPPSRHPRRLRKKRPVDRLGPRVIELQLRGMSHFQKRKLDRVDPALRSKVEDGLMTFAELCALGNDSYLSIMVMAYDRFSGSRSVSTLSAIYENDVRRVNSNMVPGQKEVSD
jgi:hypothetical protein